MLTVSKTSFLECFKGRRSRVIDSAYFKPFIAANEFLSLLSLFFFWKVSFISCCFILIPLYSKIYKKGSSHSLPWHCLQLNADP